MYNSDAKQDEFVANLFNFKKGGCYVDIGSCGAIGSNNTYFFDRLGWEGICVEIESGYNSTYQQRTCEYINDDALGLDYKNIFEKKLFDIKFSKNIDYLSVDIDQLSYDALLKMPVNEYKFKIITIEHDFYLYGNEYKEKQKKFLIGNGYTLLCENVYAEQPGYYGRECAFEDWWVHPNFFDNELINKISCKNQYPSQIISRFR